MKIESVCNMIVMGIIAMLGIAVYTILTNDMTLANLFLSLFG